MGKLEEARRILEAFGLPPAQCNEMSGYVLLALCGVREADSWKDASRTSRGVTKGIMSFIESEYGRRYAPNTRETFRRFVLHQFVQARLVDYNPDLPELPTNSPRAHYAISAEGLEVVRSFGSRAWTRRLAGFRAARGSLVETYDRVRRRRSVPVRLPNGTTLSLSAGGHNVLIRSVVEEFAPRFAAGATLLYLGDTADKNAFVDSDALQALGADVTDHGRLPDVVLHLPERDWLFLVEAVTSHGPMTPKRLVELQDDFGDCRCGLVFVTAFPDFAQFRKHLKDIAWETEVWVAENPDHMIHFNGDRFLGPRESPSGA